MRRMLTLALRVGRDAVSQQKAFVLKNGFTRRQWEVLRDKVPRVHEARLTIIPPVQAPGEVEYMLLCTSYDGPEQAYYRDFWQYLNEDFQGLVEAAADISLPEDGDDERAFQVFAQAIEQGNLTREPVAADALPEPAPPGVPSALGDRKQFVAVDASLAEVRAALAEPGPAHTRHNP